MKTALLLLLLMVLLNGAALGSGPTTIDIATTNAGVAYVLHDYDMRIDKDHQTPDEIETWIRTHSEGRVGQVVVICPDERTTYKTVFEMLRRLKAAGAQQFIVATREDVTDYMLLGTTDKIRSFKDGTVAPPK
ncbi:MAG: hypothetical protein JWL59_241 [Chthoniobacteraceae bacterium]|nr:hypothetical protein [Chthoniobacteraceae bacterium]